MVSFENSLKILVSRLRFDIWHTLGVKVYQIAKSYLKFQLIPLVFCGTAFSILTKLTVMNWVKVTDYNVFNVLQTPSVFWTLFGFSILYLLIVYKKTWHAAKPTKWRTLLFCGIALFIGLYASSVNYILNLGDWLFYTINIMENHKLDSVLQPWPYFVGFFCFITSQMFQSADKKAVTVFNTQNLLKEITNLLNYIERKL